MEPLTDRLLADIDKHDLAAARLVFIRTREPGRAAESLRLYALTRGRPFRHWDMSEGGWRVYDPSGNVATRSPAAPAAAVRSVLDLGSKPARPHPPGTVAVFSDLAPFLGQGGNPPNPELVSVLRATAWKIAEAQQNFVAVLVPENLTVPGELARDIPVIDHALPNAQELEASLTNLFRADGEMRGGTALQYAPDEMRSLARSAAGMTLLEAETAASLVLIEHSAALPHIPFLTFNRSLMKAKADIVKASGFLELMPPVDIENVGGLDRLKEWLDHRASDMTEAAQASGVKRPRGLTVIGPPGTGKSLVAGTVATRFGLPGVKLHFDALLGGLVGQSEANLRRVLSDIQGLGECVVFADEIDRTLGMNGGNNDGGVNKRMIGKLLDFMQTNTSGAFFVFAANRAEGIDSALIRRGRIDAVFAVLPPNSAERLEILRIHLAKAKRNPDEVQGLQRVAEHADGYVGAELESAVQCAASTSFRTGKPITGEMILAELQTIKPLSQSFADDFNRMKEWAANNAIWASTPDSERTVIETMEAADSARIARSFPRPTRRRTMGN